MAKKSSIAYLDTLITVISTVAIFLLPLLFFTGMTDFFIIPKQILIVFSTCAVLLCWSIKVIMERKLVVVLSPLNLPLIIFGAVVLVSAIISPNRYDSLIQA